jgi:HEAT repeat protein
MSFADLVKVDTQMRQTTSMEWISYWRRLSINSFFTSEMSENARRAVVVFASFNPNGFIRERAVLKLKDYAGTLPFTILRLNDWVPQVRQAAVESADYRLARLADGELIAALPFADKLSRSGRARNANTYIKRILTAMTSEENEKELTAGLNSSELRTRRICATALFNKEQPRYDLAANQLQNETDPFLRANIFRRLISRNQDVSVIAEVFLTDKYPLNRGLALQYLGDRKHINAPQWAEKLLLDKSASVRETARCYLKKNLPAYDYCSYYKSHLNDSTATAILGLGETGAAEVAGEIENYLRSKQPSVVRAALTAMMRLNSAKYTASTINFLADSREGVVKTARNLLLKTTVPDYGRVLEIFRATQYPNTKQKCFSILLTASKWQRLVFILEALESGDSSLRESAKFALNKWIGSYNRSYAVAAPAQIEEIRKRIERLRRVLTDETQRQLLFLCR